MVKNTEIWKEIQGIKINTIDPGGKLQYDAEGNVSGKTEPLLEMVHSHK